MNSEGVVNLASKYSLVETIDRLETLLRSKGIKIFARIDQAAEAKAVGQALRPTVLVIFGDPRAGTPLMEKYPSLALDLPSTNSIHCLRGTALGRFVGTL